ncbi:MAG TPA: acyltransferase [Acidimicrobiales bacterium]|nr:acyltransferase [Acidimicrobiales bacterium]
MQSSSGKVTATASEADPSGTRQRLDHIDAMRPIKQTAVISTHALLFFSPLSTSLLASGLLTLTHFSRDAFLFVSACMLAYSYRNSETIAMSHYWKRRFMAVGLVYLVWTVIYFPLAALTPSSTFPYFHLPLSSLFSSTGAHNFFVSLTTGYYHLYFLLVLLEFYVVFPYVFKLLRRFPRSHLYVVAGAVLWQFVFPYVVRRGWFGFSISSKLETRLVFSYSLYLLGGVVAAFYLDAFHDWVLRHRSAILSLTVVAGAVPIVLDYLHAHGVAIPKIIVPGGDPFAAAVIPFDVGAIIAVYLLGVYLVSPQRSARTKAITTSGSEAAYGIYVSQMVWILVMHRWAVHFNLFQRVPWLVLTILAVTLTYLLGWIFSAVVARTPLSRALVGRSRLPWTTLLPQRRQLASAAHGDFGDGPLNLTD